MNSSTVSTPRDAIEYVVSNMKQGFEATCKCGSLVFEWYSQMRRGVWGINVFDTELTDSEGNDELVAWQEVDHKADLDVEDLLRTIVQHLSERKAL